MDRRGDEDQPAETIEGPLITWYVEGLDYYQTIVNGAPIDTETIEIVRSTQGASGGSDKRR
jgi:hypothetical protein